MSEHYSWEEILERVEQNLRELDAELLDLHLAGEFEKYSRLMAHASSCHSSYVYNKELMLKGVPCPYTKS